MAKKVKDKENNRVLKHKRDVMRNFRDKIIIYKVYFFSYINNFFIHYIYICVYVCTHELLTSF